MPGSRVGGLGDVVGRSRPGRRAVEERRLEHLHAVHVDLGEGRDGAVVVLAEEHEIEDPDDASVDEVDEQGEGLPGHPIGREREDDVVDRAELVEVGGLLEVCGHVSPIGRNGWAW